MKWQWNQELFIEMCSAIHKQLNCALSPVQTPSHAITFCWAISLEQTGTVSKDTSMLNSSNILLQLKFGSLFWHFTHHPPRKEQKIIKRFGSSYVVMAWTCVRWGLGWILRKCCLPRGHRTGSSVHQALSLPGLKKPLDNVPR